MIISNCGHRNFTVNTAFQNQTCETNERFVVHISNSNDSVKISKRAPGGANNVKAKSSKNWDVVTHYLQGEEENFFHKGLGFQIIPPSRI